MVRSKRKGVFNHEGSREGRQCEGIGFEKEVENSEERDNWSCKGFLYYRPGTEEVSWFNCDYSARAQPCSPETVTIPYPNTLTENQISLGLVCKNTCSRGGFEGVCFVQSGMELRVLYAVAYQKTWYGRWGYNYGRGGFNISRPTWRKAMTTLSSVPVESLLQEVESTDTVLARVISLYQVCSPACCVVEQ